MLTLSVPHSIISFATKKKLSLLGNCVTVARQTLTLFVGVRIPIPQPMPRNKLFRGFFMPEYCFLRRYSSKVSAFFAKFLLYFSRCTRSELLCRCHSFRLKSQDFSGLCSRRYIRAFPTICRCQRQTIPHRLRRKIQDYRI